MAYATLADLTTTGLPATALGALTSAQQQGALDDASAEMDGYFAGRYALPLSSWDVSVTKVCLKIAVWNLLKTRGFNPASGADSTIRMDYDDALDWLNRVQRKALHPPVTPAAGQSPTYDQPFVISSSVTTMDGRVCANRGW